ncbi:hypothetical protein V6N13_091463 [Hibiscus sabdariffa]
MDGPSNIGEKGDDGLDLRNAGSKFEFVTYNGSRRPHNVFTSSMAIANIALSDSDFVRHREAILWEVIATVCLGRLMRVKMIGVHDL